MKKIKYWSVVILFFSMSWGQENSFESQIIKNLNGLLDRVTIGIEDAVQEGKIKGSIAITRIVIADLEPIKQKKIKAKIIKKLESIVFPKNSFKLVEFLLISPDLTNQSQLLFDRELNHNIKQIKAVAESYAMVELGLGDKRIEFNLTVKQIEDHQTTWQKKWQVLDQQEDFFFQLGLTSGLDLDLKNVPFYLSFMMLKRSYRFFEWGFFFDVGAGFFSFEQKTFQEQLSIYNRLGLYLGIEIFELAKLNYFGVEMLLTFKTGNHFSYLISDQEEGQQNFVINLMFTPGLGFIFSRNYALLFDFGIIEKMFSIEMGIRF